jgi:ribosomal protein L11 methyltransferase
LNCSISRRGAICKILLFRDFNFEEQDESEEELEMKTKPLWKISIATTPEAEDAVAEMLDAVLSRTTVAYLNVETGMSTVTVYCEARPAAGVRKTIAARLAQIKKCGLKIGPGKITIAKVRREDWAESWKRHFKPIEIGDALLVKPSWSKRRPRKYQAVVILDPGLSFGTGQHPTTAFCLDEIVRFSNAMVDALLPRRTTAQQRLRHQTKTGAEQSFLDIGTGSGILAIAAAKLGYRPVRAFDFDADAVRIARTNARINHVQAKLKIKHADVSQLPMPSARKYDLICANLISNLLIAERRRIAAQLNRGGTLVLAGILKSEFREVRAAFEKLRLKLVSRKTEMEWQSGSFRLV